MIMEKKSAYAWGLLTQLGPTALTLITTMILTRILTPSDYGMIGVLTIFFTIANVLIDSGLCGSLINERNISKIDCSTIAAFNLAIGITIYGAMFLFAPYLEEYYNSEGLCKLTRFVSIIFVIYPLGLVPKALLSKRVDFKKQFVISITSNILSSIVAISLAYSGYGVYSLACMQVTSAFMSMLLSCFLCKYVPQFSFSYAHFKKLIPFGAYTTFSSVIDSIYENLLLSLAGKYISISQTGYIRQAKNAETMMSSALATTISNVSFPILVKYQGDNQKFRVEANNIFRTILLFILPLLALASVYSKQIILILYGAKWIETVYYLQILLIAGIFMVMETLIRCFIKSSGQVDRLFRITIIKRLVGIGLLVVTALYNPSQLVVVYTACTLFAFICNVYVYAKIINTSILKLLMYYTKLIMPMVIILLLGHTLRIYDIHFVIMTMVIGCVVLVYYFKLFRIFSINIISMIKNKL